MSYSPTLMRWTTQDPMGFVDGMNSFVFVNDSPVNKVDPQGMLTEKEIAGVIYGETSSIYPQYKSDATEKSWQNWDPNSWNQLEEARAWIGAIAAKGGKTIKPTYPSADELKNPLVHKIWDDAQYAAKFADPSKIPEDCKHFVIWISSNGKTPDEKPKIPADWPYTQKDKIIHTFGPFRVSAKGGDVPVSNNIYIIIYEGVK